MMQEEKEDALMSKRKSKIMSTVSKIIMSEPRMKNSLTSVNPFIKKAESTY